MKKTVFGTSLMLAAFLCFVSISMRAQEDFEDVKISRIAKMAIEAGKGEIRGYGQGISSSEQLALNVAKAQAVADLRQQIEQYVRYGLDQYFEEVGVDDASSFDEEKRNLVVNAAKGVVEGVTILDSRKAYSKSKRKYLYEVCVKYDKVGILSVIEAQNERILKNKVKFEKEMQEAWDELDERNSRKTVAERQAEREERLNEMEQSNLDRESQRIIELEKVQGKNAVELEKARSKNQMDKEAKDEAKKDREIIRKAATQKNTSKRRIVFEED